MIYRVIADTLSGAPSPLSCAIPLVQSVSHYHVKKCTIVARLIKRCRCRGIQDVSTDMEMGNKCCSRRIWEASRHKKPDLIDLGEVMVAGLDDLLCYASGKCSLTI